MINKQLIDVINQQLKSGKEYPEVQADLSKSWSVSEIEECINEIDLSSKHKKAATNKQVLLVVIIVFVFTTIGIYTYINIKKNNYKNIQVGDVNSSVNKKEEIAITNKINNQVLGCSTTSLSASTEVSHWKNIDLPIGYTIIQFINDRVGFAADQEGGLHKTIDGGINWLDISKIEWKGSTELRPVTHFLDEKNWLSALTVSNGGLRQPGEITKEEGQYVLKTYDSGNTWVEKMWLPASNHMSVKKFYFLDSKKGWLIMGSTNYKNNDLLYKTDDGGDNWALHDSNIFHEINGLFFINDNEGWAYGKGESVNNGLDTSDKIWSTVDGGLSWNEIYSTTTQLKNIFFVDSQVGFMYNKHKILKTIDGGKNWIGLEIINNVEKFDEDKKMLSVENALNNYLKVYFKDKMNGYLFGGGYIFETNNGAISWKIAKKLGLYNWGVILSDMIFIDNIGIVYGSDVLSIYRADCNEALIESVAVDKEIIKAEEFSKRIENTRIYSKTPQEALEKMAEALDSKDIETALKYVSFFDEQGISREQDYIKLFSIDNARIDTAKSLKTAKSKFVDSRFSEFEIMIEAAPGVMMASVVQLINPGPGWLIWKF
ncbi:MAG: hypothetical protein WCG01_00855 [bacterium]